MTDAQTLDEVRTQADRALSKLQKTREKEQRLQAKKDARAAQYVADIARWNLEIRRELNHALEQPPSQIPMRNIWDMLCQQRDTVEELQSIVGDPPGEPGEEEIDYERLRDELLTEFERTAGPRCKARAAAARPNGAMAANPPPRSEGDGNTTPK
jgi:hydroxypyruvate isomerase